MIRTLTDGPLAGREVVFQDGEEQIEILSPTPVGVRRDAKPEDPIYYVYYVYDRLGKYRGSIQKSPNPAHGGRKQ